MAKYLVWMTCLAVASMSGLAFAHHSYGAYDTTKTVSIEGSVTKVEYANPHVYVSIKVKDVEYGAEFPAVTVLRQSSFTASALKIGDVVVATGSPMRDRDNHRISLMKEIRRPSDGWIWSRAQ